MGHRYTRALFLETCVTGPSTIRYTLKEYDHKGYPSLYRLYMAETDPTEYTFSNKYFDGWSHWQELCECDWFKPYITAWRKEFELRLRAEAVARLMDVASGASREAVQVNKWLAEGMYQPKGKKGSTGRGRPSKEEISKEAVRIAESDSQIDEHYLRLIKPN